jgi:hypothetical protein
MIILSFHLNLKSLYGAFPSNDVQHLSLQDSTHISNSLFSDIQFGIHIGQISETKGDSYQYLKWGFSINPCLSRYFGLIMGWSQIKTDHKLHQIVFQNPPSIYNIPTMYGATILSYGFRINIPIERSSFLLDLYRLNRNKYDHKTGFGYNIGFQFLVVKQIYLSLSYENNIYNFNLVCGANTDFYNGYQISLKYGLNNRN